MEINVKFDEKMVSEAANRVLDEFQYNGKTIRAWADTLTYPKTNADRIRAMSDEELSNWLWAYADGSGKTPPQWLDWLSQEATDG